MNPVGELLTREDIALDLDVSGKQALLEQLAAMLARRAHLPEIDILQALNAREALGSTALGRGVAIPHARMAGCVAAAAAFVRTRSALSFGAPDGGRVSLFLALIVPQQANQKHLRLLATAAAMFSDPSLRGALRTDTDPGQVLKLLADWTDDATAGRAAS
jgi:PTS system nitrogen regulatory IIA component